MRSFPQTLDAFSRRVNQRLFLIGAALLGFMPVPTFIDIVCRFFFGFSLVGVIEVEEMMLSAMVFCSWGTANIAKSHTRVDLFFGRFTHNARTALTLCFSLLSAVLFAIVWWYLVDMGIDKYKGNEASWMLGIPLFYSIFFGAFGLVGFIVSLVSDVLNAFSELAGKKAFISLSLAFAAAALVIAMPVVLRVSPLVDEPLRLGGLGMAFLMLMLFLGMPIGIAMAGVGLIGLLGVLPNPVAALSMMGLGSYTESARYVFTVVPMFILMGEFALYSGVSRDLFSAANTWFGRFPGGIAVAGVTGCAGFAAVSGDSMATAVTMSSVALPEMRKKNYEPGFACATLAAGGTLGILIPPSAGFIFFSLVTEVSIGRLFVAGIIPGILLAGLFVVMVMIFAIRHPRLAPPGEDTTFREKILSLRKVTAMIGLIILVLGGILSGAFSPNEGGAVGATGTLIYAVCTRRITWKQVWRSITTTTTVSAQLMLILVGVGLLGYFFAATRLPFELSDRVVGMDANRYAIFAAVVLLYIVLGCLVNVIPMMLLTMPAIFPSIEALGFDPVWFGVVTIILLEMGQITPPVGINVFALATVAKDVPMAGIFRRIVPYFTAMLFMVVILTIFPGLVTWLPDRFYGPSAPV
ncbi:MAG: TRAP transporter large permease subunit [Candidatus Accumulibacter sp.]|nr:TRAP transporter large permease subunit [Accumulibacter sp.]